MNLLAVDTATEKLSIALAADNKGLTPFGSSLVRSYPCKHGRDLTPFVNGAKRHEVWLFEADAGLRHSELAMETIDMLFKKAVLKPEDLSGIVCMGGPGSFTGLRIGFSLAKGLALALGCPFAAIPTLDCMTRPLSSLKGLVMPVLDAKKSSFFCALYRDGKKISADMDAVPEAIGAAIAAEAASTGQEKQALLFGPGAQMLHGKLTQLSQSPLANIDILVGKGLRWGNAQTLLEIALETDIFANSVTDFSIGPEYIRKSDAEEEREKP